MRLVRSPAAAKPDEGRYPWLTAYEAELDYLYRTLRRLGVALTEIDDVAHEVYLVLQKVWSQFDATRPFRPFLFGIAFRVASFHQRKSRRELPLGIVETEDYAPAPDRLLEAKQARAVVLSALAEIPLPRRAILVMHDIDEVPIREIAPVLRIPLFTAYSRLRKARKELEKELRKLLREIEPSRATAPATGRRPANRTGTGAGSEPAARPDSLTPGAAGPTAAQSSESGENQGENQGEIEAEKK